MHQNFFTSLRKLFPVLFLFTLISSCSDTENVAGSNESTVVDHPDNEVIYHVVQRSFFDSNGDLHGDIEGLKQKLDYLQELGVTSLLLLPLYESQYYHNYFTGDFGSIDPEFGTRESYIELVKEVHRRGMKIYMDMETQYVTEEHPWYKESYGNPSSPYTEYLIYNDDKNLKPESIIFNLEELPGYDGTVLKVATVNLNSPKVWQYNYELFKGWVDPNGDGNFDDGVDGFRYDHMMDDLDAKGILTNLFVKFWKPLTDSLKSVNPQLTFIAEQADWSSFGNEYLTTGGVDRVFAFRIEGSIRSFKKEVLEKQVDSTFLMTPEGKQQIVFIGNHDMVRFSNAVGHDSGKLRVGAALNLLIGGIPSIYYGEEIGMRGAGGWGKYGWTDANDIPHREAFEWNADTSSGLATWYENSGPWWDSTNLKSNDGISVEEQKDNPNSLWNYYRKLIELRRTNAPLVKGKYQNLHNTNDQVYSFARIDGNRSAIIVVNLSDAPQETAVHGSLWKSGKLKRILGAEEATVTGNEIKLNLAPYSVHVWLTE